MRNDIEYVQAYTELNCLFKYFPEEYLSRIPENILLFFSEKHDEKFEIEIDFNSDLKSQKLSKKTCDILAILKYNYLSTDEEKEKISKKMVENELAYQDELRQKYNNVFDNNKKVEDIKREVIEDKQTIVVPRESFVQRVKNWIKKFWGRA